MDDVRSGRVSERSNISGLAIATYSIRNDPSNMFHISVMEDDNRYCDAPISQPFLHRNVIFFLIFFLERLSLSLLP